MARKVRRGQFHDNHERWLISYADFITLLFAFFVVMYSISSVNEGKYKVFSASLVTAFGHKPAQPESVLPTNQHEEFLKLLVDRRNARLAELQRKQQEFLQNIASSLTHVMKPLVKSGQVSVTQTNRGVVLDINANALFSQGDAVLQAGAVKTLAEVAQVLRGGELAIEVEGHTDDIPIKTPQYPSNWELSSARASSVVRLFIEHGVQSSRLSAVGVADNQPVVPNNTPENRARNRRVSVTILAPLAEREPAPLLP
ncbi:MAG: flagellar motor protein MotD [Sideroxydans sp.]|nr:flagellar motor protein MotD [Sideroxydans sp.]